MVILTLICLALQNEREEGKIRLPSKPDYRVTVRGDVGDFVLHDLNGDGYLDLAVAANRGGEDARNVVFLSRKGRFREVSWASKDSGVGGAVAAGDLDGDGDPDLVVTRFNHDPAVAYRNKGGGQFEVSPFWTSEDTEWSQNVVLGDFDRNGRLDVFAADRIYFGSKEGLHREYGWKLPDDPAISGKVLADVDGDRRQDLILSSWLGDAAYAVYRGLEKNFEKKPSMQSNVKGEFSSLTVGDLDGDGFPEILVGSRLFRSGDGRVRLYKNRGGKVDADPSWSPDDVDCNVAGLVLADFDRDSDLDLYVAASEHTAIYENRGGKLHPQPSWRAINKGSTTRAADLDRNGWLDLVGAAGNGIYFFMGGPNVPVQRDVKPFPKPPALPPLTLKDLLPGIDLEAEALLDTYRKTKKVTDEMREQAPQILSAMSLSGEEGLEELSRELRPRAEEIVGGLIRKLADESFDLREKATEDLIKMGLAAVPALKRAAAGEDAEVSVRARRIVETIEEESRLGHAEAIEVLGMKLARLTPRLKRRYGHKDIEGVVVLGIPETLGPQLGLTNIREGDVILGIGPLGEYGRVIDPARSPLEMLKLIIKHDKAGEEEGRGWLLAGYRYICGPLHPSYQGTKREWRMDLTPAQWFEIKGAIRNPTPWRPER